MIALWIDIIIWVSIGIMCIVLLAETQQIKVSWKGYYSLRVLLGGIAFLSVSKIMLLDSIKPLVMVEHFFMLILLLLVHWFVITHPDTF